jgi:aryl-alcohol dehydrogenase-like predicted oxidoreductase
MISRRNFGKLAGGALLAGMSAHLGSLKLFGGQGEAATAMKKRALGRTGHNVGLFSLGGQSVLEESGTEKESVAMINRALDLGVNYIDTAAWYGDGQSERYIGAVMQSRRDEVFLATKSHDRSYDGSMRYLERSLKNLRTDVIDLWQLHNVRTDDDLSRIFGERGAIKALEEAQSDKRVRFLGITGHYDPLVLKRAIEEYPFDSILMALNAADRHNKSFIENLLPVAVEKKMAVVGMKVPARGRIFRKGGVTTMETAMRYVLTLPVSTVIVGIETIAQLEENIRIAREFSPMSADEMAVTEDLTKEYFADASWFKSSW